MSLRTRLSVLLLSTPALAFIIVGGLLGHAAAGTDDQKYQHLRVFDEVVGLVLNNYVEEVKPERVMEGAMRGLADGLDPDSAYLTAAQVKDLESAAPLPDGDVGMELTRQFYLRVIAARDGSPAARAGLQTGDYVRGIDGRPTRDLSVFEGSRLLRGQPGTKVLLTIIRGNAADPHEVTLVREKASGPLVSSRLIGTVGYVRVTSFGAGVPDELTRHVADLSRGGATSLALDVRRTATGAYENGVAAARLFVKSGTLAVTAGRSGDPREVVRTRPGDGAITLPAVVLMTAGTSGAAEIFAAALSDNARAELIGEHTIGRAGLQKLVKLPEDRGLWLTSARYIRPKGENAKADVVQPKDAATANRREGAAPGGDPALVPKSTERTLRDFAIHGKGLMPDVAIEDPDVEFGAAPSSADPILDAAVTRLKAVKKAA